MAVATVGMSIRFPSDVHRFLTANSQAGLGSINEQIVELVQHQMKINERHQRRVAEREASAIATDSVGA
jgi:hypothetical protein